MASGQAAISQVEGRRIFQAVRVSIPDLIVSALSNYSDLPIVDQTGLKGLYQIELEVPTRRGDTEVSIFESVAKLGLRLEKRPISIDSLAVDHIEKAPTEN